MTDSPTQSSSSAEEQSPTSEQQIRYRFPPSITTTNHMKKFVDICYCYCTWQIGSWNNLVNTFSIDLVTQVTKYYIHFSFLSPSSSTWKFPHIDQKVQLFAIKLILTKAYFMKILECQNLPKHAHALTFPIHFSMGQFGNMNYNSNILWQERDISDSG